MDLLLPIMTVLLIAVGAFCLFTAMDNADRLRLNRKKGLTDRRFADEMAAAGLAWKSRE
ncbi:hypothetical protein [Paenibacillus ginsengihumi]|uniref:hypothetical protein n=1 Tax=Paenibacillus ginsengihumi TaxID=431596 RepID=UPI00037A71FD|nr:hypothetical protein [Paenibacillus ginsengihumi]